MKLVHPDLQFQVEFKEVQIPICIVESPVYWRKIQMELLTQCQGKDGKWVLSHDDKELKFLKSVEMIMNPIQLEENQKQIITSFLHTLGQKAMSEDYWKKGQELNAEIQKFFAEIEREFPFEFCIHSEIDFTALAKAMGIQIESDYETVLERLLQYCILVKEIKKNALFIFWNLHDYFTVSELKRFYQEIMVRKWNVLLMENSIGEHLPMEKHYIIDKDNCEIY